FTARRVSGESPMSSKVTETDSGCAACAAGASDDALSELIKSHFERRSLSIAQGSWLVGASGSLRFRVKQRRLARAHALSARNRQPGNGGIRAKSQCLTPDQRLARDGLRVTMSP